MNSVTKTDFSLFALLTCHSTHGHITDCKVDSVVYAGVCV